jgi:hypothetical protein
MRFERPRLELGMKLHADEPGMVLILIISGARPATCRKAYARLLQAILIAVLTS